LKKVYFISGLGADERAFKFLDLSFCEPVFIEWIAPHEKETLQHYALRLRDKIKEEAPVIVGLSFGGMLLTEMAKNDNTIKGLLISSAKFRKELPGYYRAMKFLPLNKILPAGILKKMAARLSGLFGVNLKEHRSLLKEMIRDTDPTLLRWSVSAIVGWENETIPSNLIHIHGTADRILPYKRVHADTTIKNGTHMMPFNNAREITEFLKNNICL
jgi:pimeloyl-ACP methyl ester carboxylesterase